LLKRSIPYGCYTEITLKTDPKNNDYIVEHGAKRNYEAWKDAQRTETLIKEIRQGEEEGSAMKALEHKTHDMKREMEILDALDDIKLDNKRKSQVSHDQLLESMLKYYEEDEGAENERKEVVKEKFRIAKQKALNEEEEKKSQTLWKHESKSREILSFSDSVKNGPKAILKAKKVKTTEESLQGGMANLAEVSRNTERKPKGALMNFCAYSDDET